MKWRIVLYGAVAISILLNVFFVIHIASCTTAAARIRSQHREIIERAYDLAKKFHDRVFTLRPAKGLRFLVRGDEVDSVDIGAGHSGSGFKGTDSLGIPRITAWRVESLVSVDVSGFPRKDTLNPFNTPIAVLQTFVDPICNEAPDCTLHQVYYSPRSPYFAIACLGFEGGYLFLFLTPDPEKPDRFALASCSIADAVAGDPAPPSVGVLRLADPDE